MPSINFTESNILAALRSVLMTYGFHGHPFPIVRGQMNRVPEPRQDDFLVMWPIMRNRISTNRHDYQDIQIKGSIKDNTLNVTFIPPRKVIKKGVFVSKATEPSFNACIREQVSGNDGGVGDYLLDNAPDSVNQILYVGVNNVMQPTEAVIQCDIHGPCSGDNAQLLSTLFRDWFSVRAFRDQGYEITPLFADEPRQVPFTNAEQQFEERWVVDLHLQVNQIVSVSQQFADKLDIETVEVETLILS